MKIKSIFLDFAGVISKESHITKGYLYPNLKEYFSYDELNTRYKLASYGKITFNEMIKGAPRELWKKHLKKAVTSIGTFITVKNLSKNYSLHIASNNLPVLFEKEVKKFKIKKYFKHIFVSYKLKLKKPHNKFYETILAKSKSKAEESVFVDDAKSNLFEPKKMGFVTIWFDNKYNPNDERNKIEFEPDYIIKSLNQLPKILKELKEQD